MPDSWTQSDIDRCYGRIKKQVDLSKIKNKRGFSKAIKENPTTKYWSEKLSDFFWDIHTQGKKVIEAVPEIEYIPSIPREKLTPVQKRKETIEKKEKQIEVKESYKQKSYKRSSGRKWVDIEMNFAQKLKKDGLSYKQIAEQLKRTKSSVSTKLYRLNKLK